MGMNGLIKMAATALLLVLAIVPAAVATSYVVGDSQGWSIGVDYASWVTGKTFKVGDTLVFLYGPSDSVNEVDAAGYASCGGSPINTYSSGYTEIELKTVGSKYFICPTPGRCESGMKVSVKVVDASSGSSDTLIMEE